MRWLFYSSIRMRLKKNIWNPWSHVIALTQASNNTGTHPISLLLVTFGNKLRDVATYFLTVSDFFCCSTVTIGVSSLLLCHSHFSSPNNLQSTFHTKSLNKYIFSHCLLDAKTWFHQLSSDSFSSRYFRESFVVSDGQHGQYWICNELATVHKKVDCE